MRATVTAKGQVTIPRPVRDLLGIVPGSRVDFRRAADGSVVLTRADGKRPASRFNHVLYAELSVRYRRVEDLEAFLDKAGLEIVSVPRAALFLAGKVFTAYCMAGGSRKGCCRTSSSVPMPSWAT